jgi:ribonuclease BN (tRNA processing enzyme)
VTEITFVGTSDAFGAGGRRQSAILLRGASGNALIDCGATTGSGLHELGVSIDEIDVILISHFHADHFGGIPLLLLAALYEENRKRQLQIAGPPGIEARVRRLADAMGHGFEGRAWAFPIHFVELPAGVRSEIGPLRIRSFATHHNPDAIAARPADRRRRREDRLLRRHRLVRRPAAPGRGQRPVHLRVHLSPQRLRLPPLARAAGREPRPLRLRAMILTHLGQEMADRRGKSEFETADDGLTIRI